MVDRTKHGVKCIYIIAVLLLNWMKEILGYFCFLSPSVEIQWNNICKKKKLAKHRAQNGTSDLPTYKCISLNDYMFLRHCLRYCFLFVSFCLRVYVMWPLCYYSFKKLCLLSAEFDYPGGLFLQPDKLRLTGLKGFPWMLPRSVLLSCLLTPWKHFLLKKSPLYMEDAGRALCPACQSASSWITATLLLIIKACLIA